MGMKILLVISEYDSVIAIKFRGIYSLSELNVEIIYKFVNMIQTYSIDPKPIRCMPKDPHMITCSAMEK